MSLTDITHEHVISDIRPIGDGIRIDYVGPDGLWSKLVYGENGDKKVELIAVTKGHQMPEPQYRDQHERHYSS